MKKKLLILGAILFSALTSWAQIPESLKVRYNNHWDGETMEVINDIDGKHFHYEGWLGTNRNEGVFVNFKSGDDFWCPRDKENCGNIELHIAENGEVVTDLYNSGSTEDGGYAFKTFTTMASVDVYFYNNGDVKVKCTDSAVEHAGDAVYIAAEQKNGWSRDADKCYVLPKIADGVFEGTITAIRENEYYDVARFFLKPNNGDNDDYIGFGGLVYAADGTYELSRRPNADFRIRKGDQKITVDLNEGTITFKYLGEPSYMYAVGTLVDCNWQQTNHDAYKLVETEAGSLVFRGIVKVAEDGDSRFTLFEERSSTGWQEGRWVPADEGSRNITKDEWRTNFRRWADDSWRIPAGTYMVTMDVAKQRMLCTDVHTQQVVIGEAGYATFVAEYPYAEIPTGAEVKAAQVKTNYVHLEDMTEVPAGEAVVLQAAPGTYTFTEAAVAKSDVENDLVAATEDVTADGTQYVLAQVEGVVGFHKVKSGDNIAKGKGYLVAAAGAKMFLPFGGGEATAIDAVELFPADAAIYNLAGQKLQKLQKGINIINGKKVIIK